MATWVIVLIIIGVLLLFGTQMSLSAGKKASKILKNIDGKYETFIEQYFNNLIIQEEKNINEEDILKQVRILLKPELDAMIGFINATDLSDVRIRYDSKYFRNVARISEALFEKRHKFKSHDISHDDEEKLRKALEEAIQADLIQRLLQLKALM